MEQAGAGSGTSSDGEDIYGYDSSVEVGSDVDDEVERAMEMGVDDVDDPSWPAWRFCNFSSAGGDIAREKCKLGSPRAPRWDTDVRLLYDLSEFDLLDKFKREADEVLNRLLQRVALAVPSITSVRDLTPLACFMMALPDGFLETLSHDFLDNEHSLSEVCGFIQVELLLAFYGHSKEQIKAQSSYFVVNETTLIYHDRVALSMSRADKPSLGTPRAGQQSFAVPKIMRKMQQLFRKYSVGLFFVEGESFVELDDDKWPFISRTWRDYGIKHLSTKKRKLQVVMHLLASVSTGFLLGGWLEELELTVAEIVEDALLTLFDKSKLEAIDAEKIAALKVFTDRGYIVIAGKDSESNILQLISRSQAKVHATVRNSMASIFRTVDRPVAPEGCKGITLCKFGKKTILNSWTAEGRVGVALVRQGQGRARTVPLLTTDPTFPFCSWTAQVARRHRDAASPGGVRHTPQATMPSDGPPSRSAVDRAAKAKQAVMASLTAVTSAQRTPDWFLARLFRSSSTNTHVTINCVTADFFNTPELRELHAKCKLIARLQPRESVTEANAAGKIDPNIHEQAVPTTHRQAGGRRGKKADPTKPGHWNPQCHDEGAAPADASRKRGADGELLGKAKAARRSSKRRSLAGLVESGVAPDSQHGDSESDDSSDNTVVETSDASAHKTFLRLMMRQWFMRPLHYGPDNASPVVVGAETDENVLRLLPAFLQRHGDGHLIVGPVSTHGLVARRDVPYAATSPDGLVFVTKGGVDLGPAVVEVKTSTTSATIDDLQADACNHGPFVECDAGSDLFEVMVRNPSYRTQAVHDAAVMGVELVLVVFASPSAIKRCVLLRVAKVQRDTWIALLGKLQANFMQFAYGAGTDWSFPRLGPDNSPAYAFAGEHHTVDIYVRLWRSLNEDVVANGTPPPFSSLLPSMSAYWNRHMGGCDIARKLINSISPSCHSRKPISTLIITLLRYVFHNAFRLWQLVQLHPLFDRFKQYSDMQRARARIAFRPFLSMVHKELGGLPHEAMLKFRPELAKTRARNVDGVMVRLAPPSSTRSTLVQAATADAPAEANIWGTRKRNFFQIFNDDAVVARRLSTTVPHKRVVMEGSKRCRLCCLHCSSGKTHKVQVGKKSRSAVREPARTNKYCETCSGEDEGQRMYLCKACWGPWHTQTALQVPACTNPDFLNPA